MACTVDLMKFPFEEIKIGHWTDKEAETGCTVIRFPKSVVASGEVKKLDFSAHLINSPTRCLWVWYLHRRKCISDGLKSFR